MRGAKEPMTITNTTKCFYISTALDYKSKIKFSITTLSPPLLSQMRPAAAPQAETAASGQGEAV